MMTRRGLTSAVDLRVGLKANKEAVPFPAGIEGRKLVAGNSGSVQTNGDRNCFVGDAVFFRPVIGDKRDSARLR
jgi:hypothetical protein